MIKQAVILAGGKGLRLLPLTKKIPKPMAPINNIPFLSYLIFSLKKRGIKKVLILVGYKARKVIEFYSSNKNIPINFCFSSPKSNTGKRVLDAYKLLDKEFLLLYGDNFWSPNINKIYNKFKKNKACISTTVFNNKFGTGEYGKENNVRVRKNSFVEKYDKSRKDEKLNGVDIGFFIVQKKFLKLFKDKNTNYSFENDILTKAVELKTLVAYKTDQQYFSITNLKMLKKFEITSKKLNLNYIK
jgi:NDP-sugar pyrophosphorylase family protein|tara:strand:+ start:4427 stop:5155 length:729 start_codon:yes stop_codon:yes gene_type:complete